MRRTLFLLLFVALQLPSFRGQEVHPAKRLQCPHAWKIAPEDPKLASKSDAWTSESEDRDGIISLSYCWVFQPGMTTIKRLASNNLMQLPADFDIHRRYAELVRGKIRTDALPVGFTIYKDLAFDLRTEAVLDGSSVTIRLPSVRSEEELKHLFVLYLD